MEVYDVSGMQYNEPIQYRNGIMKNSVMSHFERLIGIFTLKYSGSKRNIGNNISQKNSITSNLHLFFVRRLYFDSTELRWPVS